MSVSAIGTTPLPSTAATGAKDAQKSGGAAQDQAAQITNQGTTTNPDGSTTTVITYSDGTTTTTTQAAPPKQANAAQPLPGGQPTTGGLLDASNVGQTATLLAAQEKARAQA